jgi:hypothetical protein
MRDLFPGDHLYVFRPAFKIPLKAEPVESIKYVAFIVIGGDVNLLEIV